MTIYDQLRDAIYYNNIKLVEKLLEDGSDQLLCCEYSLLNRALELNRQEIAILLLKFGQKSVDEPNLYAAVETNNDLVVKWLLENGYDPNEANESGKTALFVAETSKVAEILLANGAKLDIRCEEGRQPIT